MEFGGFIVPSFRDVCIANKYLLAYLHIVSIDALMALGCSRDSGQPNLGTGQLF
jgi:hypothetical protein